MFSWDGNILTDGCLSALIRHMTYQNHGLSISKIVKLSEITQLKLAPWHLLIPHSPQSPVWGAELNAKLYECYNLEMFVAGISSSYKRWVSALTENHKLPDSTLNPLKTHCLLSLTKYVNLNFDMLCFDFLVIIYCILIAFSNYLHLTE